MVASSSGVRLVRFDSCIFDGPLGLGQGIEHAAQFHEAFLDPVIQFARR
jgi:hypothetical protein